MKCAKCHAEIVVEEGSCSTGYGLNSDNEKICFACCAIEDEEYMRTHNHITLYLTKTDGHYHVSNWPGSLKLRALTLTGRHNIARTRRDAWFIHEGRAWHGVQYGSNSDLCHCRKLKAGGAAEAETFASFHYYPTP